MPQAAPQTPKPTHGWTPERRARQAAAIRHWSPWNSSTGPRTASGKARAAQNACKHGLRALDRRLMNEALAAQRACIRIALTLHRLRALNPPNELMARLHCRFRTQDHIFHIKLYQSLHHERLCKNLAFSPPFGLKVNANDG